MPEPVEQVPADATDAPVEVVLAPGEVEERYP